MEKRFERIREEAKIAGVAAGLADYFNLDRTLVRVLFVLGFFLPHFPAVIIYIILWIAIPERVFGLAYQSTPNQPPFSFMNANNPPNPNAAKNNIVGGVVLIVLGVLFLIDRWFNIDFGDLWPLFLIAIGVWLIFRDRINGQPPFGNDSSNPTPPTPPASSYDPTPAQPPKTI
ncbi:MAG: PspC domain-containing protein [Bacteroidetes bacterium]|nr:PspC domain-containing protein [Fibrella sp.]